MRPDRPTRRRVITIFAAAVASAVTGGLARPREPDYAWHGVAMGADATILFSGIEPETARRAIATAATEIERLEGALSLFQDDSELRRLNREKVLHSPSGDLRRALALALDVANSSGGLFDPTVQALWEAHVDWFAAAPDAGLPPDEVIAKAREAVDWRKILVEPETIRIGGDQRLTLNGLGQGYVTDRVADLLYSQGLRHIFVDLGEQRAVGPRQRRRAVADRARQCGAVRADDWCTCDIGRVRAACSALPARRIICSTRAPAAAPHTGKKSPCIIAPQPLPTHCRLPSMPPQPTKSKPCSRALQEPSYGRRTTTNANGNGFRRRSIGPAAEIHPPRKRPRSRPPCPPTSSCRRRRIA